MLHPPPSPAGVVGSYHHHGIGEEVDWRPPLLYANPLGHRVPATLKIRQNCVKREPKTSARCVCFCLCPLMCMCLGLCLCRCVCMCQCLCLCMCMCLCRGMCSCLCMCAGVAPRRSFPNEYNCGAKHRLVKSSRRGLCRHTCLWISGRQSRREGPQGALHCLCSRTSQRRQKWQYTRRHIAPASGFFLVCVLPKGGGVSEFLGGWVSNRPPPPPLRIGHCGGLVKAFYLW